ncbi:MAG: DNA replication and repair protein RecF [Candidatus Tokpelaia sp. JSC189]|nr:MAG: DNA replication and repair protein RecF [Candidatus Tokpelaia sp. JSC189]
MYEAVVAIFFRPDYAEQVLLRHIALSSYRNYITLKLDFSGALVVLTGCNGAGKTNLLEAISFLSPGRGLRCTAYHDVTSFDASCHNSSGFGVHARLDCATYGEALIGTGLIGAGRGKSGRRVRINGTPQFADMMLEYCRIIWLIPAMDALFTGSSGDRRRFLDRMILAIDPLHWRRVLDYEKAMRSRNRLLADGIRDTGSLDAFEEQMVGLGIAIAAARHEMIRLLNTVTERILHTRDFPQARFGLEGAVEKTLLSLPAIDVEEGFRVLLREGRTADRIAGRTLSGPHCTDLIVIHKEKLIPAGLCSTGEQKALLTGLVLSHAYLTGELSGMRPILLLDEIAAHLDNKRRQTLFDILDELGAQAFMTGTDRAIFSSLEGRAEFFLVQDGHVCLMGRD